MSKWFKQLFKESHLIVVIPGIVVVLMIIGFFIYGVSDPIRAHVDLQPTLLETQLSSKEEFYQEFLDGNYTEQHPYFVLNPYEIAPLSGLILFDTENTQQYKIIVKGKTEEADLEFITDLTTNHQIPVYGLYPDYANRIELYDYDGSTETTGDLVSSILIVTNDLPSGIPDVTEISTEYSYFGDDWMMLSPATSNLPVAIDAFGDIRWYATEPLAFGFKQLGNGHFMVGSNRLMSSPYYTTGLYEMDLLGKVYVEYYIPGGYHHDFVELANGNLLVLTNEFEGTVEDVVIELERATGAIIQEWNIADYINPLDGASEMWTATDWFHANSIDYDPVSDSILVSGRHQDIVLNIGYTSHDLNYVIGDPTNWDETFTQQYFLTPVGDDFMWSYAQHSAIFTPDGDVFLFDNGNNRSKVAESYVTANNNYSRGVIYHVDTETMEISQTYSYGENRGNSFYSPYISNVAFYENNHYLIHSGGIGRTLEGALNIPAPLYDGELDVSLSSVTVEVLDGEVVYELIMPDHYYRALRISPYDDHTRVNLAAGGRVGTMLETQRYEGDIALVFTLFHNIPQAYELSIVKEADRLVIEGIFDSSDEIYLLLENESTSLTYHIPTSQSAYTAMCTAIFQDDERVVTYYVNEENLEGSFNVYIIINGHQYDSYRRVTFK